MHQFSTYVLPEQDIDYFASRVNKLKIFSINGERRLFKDNKEVSTVPLQEAVLKFLSFISQSVDRAKSQTNKNIETVLLGNNSSIFHTPVLLTNSSTDFIERLQKMDIRFADSLTLFKTLLRKNSGVVSAAHAAKDVKYLDYRHLLMQSFKDNLHHPQFYLLLVNV